MTRRRSKYGNKRTQVDGFFFDSLAESRRYLELKLLEKAEEISDLEMQPRFPIDVNGQRVCTYVADFSYMDRERGLVVEDVKGHKTQVYKLKKKLVKAVHGIDIVEVSA